MMLLKGRTVVSGKAQGVALVSTKPISFLGGVDPETGEIIEKDHDLLGKSIKDVVLCFPNGHGSTVGSYVLYSLAKRGLAPKAILNKVADPVVVVGAIIANIPMLDQIAIEKISCGCKVEVIAEGEIGLVRILRNKEE